MKKKKHVICYSGGHSSAICAIEVARKYGKENVILLNHDINPSFEDADIKRFKQEVADYIGIPITYANCGGEVSASLIKNQFEVCIEKGTFVNPANRQILCTYVLKTQPFYKWLNDNKDIYDITAYYGFDENELDRVERRKTILNDIGIKSGFPLALWGKGRFDALKEFLEYEFEKKYKKKPEPNYFENICLTEGFENQDHIERTIFSTTEIGIDPPNTYSMYKHANCKGCLKAGKQHWYVVYCLEYWIFELGKEAENIIGYSFGKEFLKDLEPQFKRMKEIGIPANENIPRGVFWSQAKKFLKQETMDMFPCQCFV